MKSTAPRSTLRKIIKKYKPQLRLAANADLLVRKERGGGEARRGEAVPGSPGELLPLAMAAAAAAPRAAGPELGRLLPKCCGLCALCDGMPSYYQWCFRWDPRARGRQSLEGQTEVCKKIRVSRDCRSRFAGGCCIVAL